MKMSYILNIVCNRFLYFKSHKTSINLANYERSLIKSVKLLGYLRDICKIPD